MYARQSSTLFTGTLRYITHLWGARELEFLHAFSIRSSEAGYCYCKRDKMCELSLSSELNRMPSIASLFRLYFDRQTMGIIRIIIIFLIKRGVGIISSYLQLTFPLDSSSRRQRVLRPLFILFFLFITSFSDFSSRVPNTTLHIHSEYLWSAYLEKYHHLGKIIRMDRKIVPNEVQMRFE